MNKNNIFDTQKSVTWICFEKKNYYPLFFVQRHMSSIIFLIIKLYWIIRYFLLFAWFFVFLSYLSADNIMTLTFKNDLLI